MKELVSNHECLECGHLITDHHQAKRGWHNGETWRGSAPPREQCIGNYGTCPCKRFKHGHERKLIIS